MRTAKDIVRDYRARGYSDERLYALACGRAEPMRGQIIALLKTDSREPPTVADAIDTTVAAIVKANPAPGDDEIPPSQMFELDDNASEIILSAEDIGAEALDSAALPASLTESELVVNNDDSQEIVFPDIDWDADTVSAKQTASVVADLPAPVFYVDESEAPDPAEIPDLCGGARTVLQDEFVNMDANIEAGLPLPPLAQLPSQPLDAVTYELDCSVVAESLAPVEVVSNTPSEYFAEHGDLMAAEPSEVADIIDLREILPVNETATADENEPKLGQVEIEFSTLSTDGSGEVWPSVAAVEAAEQNSPPAPTAEEEAVALWTEEATRSEQAARENETSVEMTKNETAKNENTLAEAADSQESNIIEFAPAYAVDPSGAVDENDLPADAEESALIKFPAEVVEAFEAIVATRPEVLGKIQAAAELAEVPVIEMNSGDNHTQIGMDQVLDMEDIALAFDDLENGVSPELHREEEKDGGARAHANAMIEVMEEMDRLRSRQVELEDEIKMRDLERKQHEKALAEREATLWLLEEERAQAQTGNATTATATAADAEVVQWIEAAEQKVCDAMSRLVANEIEREFLQQENTRLETANIGNLAELDQLRAAARTHAEQVEELKAAGEKFYAAQGELATLRQEMATLQREFNLLSTGTVPDLQQDKTDLYHLLEDKSTEVATLEDSLAGGQKRVTLFGVGAAAAMFLFITTLTGIWIRADGRTSQITAKTQGLMAERDLAKKELVAFKKNAHELKTTLKRSLVNWQQARNDLRSERVAKRRLTRKISRLEGRVENLVKLADNASRTISPRLLRVSTDSAAASTPPVQGRTRKVVAQNGDSVARICQREFGTSAPALIERIRIMNNLKRHPRYGILIHPGQTLTLPANFTPENSASAAGANW